MEKQYQAEPEVLPKSCLKRQSNKVKTFEHIEWIQNFEFLLLDPF